MWWYDMDWREKMEWIKEYIEFAFRWSPWDFEEDFVPDIFNAIWNCDVDGFIEYLEDTYDEDGPDYEEAQKYLKLFKEYKEA